MGNKMGKKTFIWVMMMFSLNVYAQEKSDSSLHETHALRMKTELSLSDEQFSRVKALNEKLRADQARLRADTSATRAGIISATKSMLAERDKKMKEILSKEQYEKWMSMTRRQPPAGQRARGSDLMSEMKKELGLTADQVKKIKTINDHMAAEFKKIRLDTTATRQNKGQAMRSVLEKRNAQVKELLTEEQYDKFIAFEQQAVRANRRGGRPVRR